MEDMYAKLTLEGTTLEKSQTRKSNAPLGLSQRQLALQFSNSSTPPLITQWKEGSVPSSLNFTKKSVTASKTETGTETGADASANSKGVGRGAGSGAKFTDLGSTQYGGAGSSKLRGRRTVTVFGSSSKERETAIRKKGEREADTPQKLKGKGSKGNTKSKMKARTNKVISSSDNDNSSPDEMNLTDASQPIESPIKSVCRKSPQVFDDTESDASWCQVMHPNPKSERSSKASSSQSRSKTESKARNDENSFSDESKSTPKKSKVKPRPAYGCTSKSYGERSSTSGLSAGKTINAKGKGKLIAALDGSAVSSSKAEQARPMSRTSVSSATQLNLIHDIFEKEVGEETPEPIRKTTVKKKQELEPFPLNPFSTRTFIGNKGKQKLAPFPMAGGIKDDDTDSDNDPLSMKGKDEILNHGGPRPFPMSSQDFEGFSSKPPSNSSTVSVSTKRGSESDDEQGPPKRRRKSNGMLDIPDIDDYSFTQPEERPDPNTLCPYCDMPFPPEPSPFLLSMLARIRNISFRDPRPSNALGLKAPLLSYVNLCQRHQFETTLLPKARAKGWPTHIKFAELPARVVALRGHLEGCLHNKDTSLFWCELKKEIDRKGVRKVMGIADQFNTFEKSQPGYYGEQGSVIIYQTLYNLFPLESVNADRVAPLTPTEFIQRVLVPETAAALVQEDMGYINKEDAICTLRESSKFGTAMFPDMDSREGGDPDGDGGVGERMVWERARARRKEIEEEDRMDEELEELERERERRETSWKKKSGRRDRYDESDADGAEDSTGKGKKVKRQEAKTDNRSDGDKNIIVSDNSSAQTDTSTTRSRRKEKSLQLSKSRNLATKFNKSPSSREPRSMTVATVKPRLKHFRVVDIASDSDTEATPQPPTRLRSDVNIVPLAPENVFDSKDKTKLSTSKSKAANLMHPLKAAKARVPRSDEFVHSMWGCPASDDEAEEVQQSSSSIFPSSGGAKLRHVSLSRQNPNAWLLSEDSTPTGTPL